VYYTGGVRESLICELTQSLDPCTGEAGTTLSLSVSTSVLQTHSR
jgi:hypothetical protein